MNKIILFTLLFVVGMNAGYASPPLPKRKVSLPALTRDLNVQESQKAKFAAEAKNMEVDLNKLRKRLVLSGGKIQGNEKDLLALEAQIESLQQEEKIIKKKLSGQKKTFARLVLVLQKIERIPPQAMIGQPKSPLKNAQTHLVLRNIFPQIQRESRQLKNNLARLSDIKDALIIDKNSAEKAKIALAQKQKNLEVLVSQKDKIYRQANKDLKAQEELVQRISLKARNVGDLVAQLERKRAEERTRNALKKMSFKKPSTLPSHGSKKLPVAGHIRVSFHEPDGFGSPSQGLSIQSREGALITAPMGGVVEFAGHFKNYGNIVILEHRNKYHSLIAGFEKIDTLVGQSVSAGEPLGRLHRPIGGKKPKLYYELRHKGKPVDPLTVLSSTS